MKYKIGQTVKITPIAHEFHIFMSDIGELAKVDSIKTNCSFGGLTYTTLYFISTINTPKIHNWAAREVDIEFPIRVGDQLLFAFMK